ncbi:MAG: RNA polymerase sigma factor [Candidatus Wildermuthbacteria bacterium]|nr:RNA polymerase sigma factor [Candidatus Wildermuthbacteria bacterium]
MEQKKKNFSKIYDQHASRVYRFIFLKVSSQEIAEDLASEVFARAWNSYREESDSEPEIKNLQAYIYQIARNVVVDHYREKGRNKVVSADEKTNIPDEGLSMEDKAGIALELERVKKALEGLQDDYQDYVIWRYLDELSVPEIAEITGKSEENVRVGIHRAIQALKERLPGGVIK